VGLHLALECDQRSLQSSGGNEIIADGSTSKGAWKMKFVGLTVAFLLVTSVSLAKRTERQNKKTAPVRTVNTLKVQGGSISFTCSPSNCREQQDGSLLFNLSCQTNKEGDKLEVSNGDQSQTIQSYGFVDIPGDLKAPKRGTVPIKISVSEREGAPQATFTFKYTTEQIKRPSCLKYGDIEL
jgi:hypothetical protein